MVVRAETASQKDALDGRLTPFNGNNHAFNDA
jgi:hypothetical protein